MFDGASGTEINPFAIRRPGWNVIVSRVVGDFLDYASGRRDDVNVGTCPRVELAFEASLDNYDPEPGANKALLFSFLPKRWPAEHECLAWEIWH